MFETVKLKKRLYNVCILMLVVVVILSLSLLPRSIQYFHLHCVTK